MSSGHFTRDRRCQAVVFELPPYPAHDRFGNVVQSKINRDAVPRRGTENLNLTSDAAVKPQLWSVKIADDQFNPGADCDVTQRRNQNPGGKDYSLYSACQDFLHRGKIGCIPR